MAPPPTTLETPLVTEGMPPKQLTLTAAEEAALGMTGKDADMVVTEEEEREVAAAGKGLRDDRGLEVLGELGFECFEFRF